MDAHAYPSALRERMGDDGVEALSQVFAAHRNEVVTFVEGRFDRRLADECLKLRTELRGEMQSLATALRGEMHALGTELRGEMQALRTELRGEMQALRAEMRGEMDTVRRESRSDMKELRADFKAEIGTLKADLIKWSFLFWIGQVAAIMAFMSAFR